MACKLLRYYKTVGHRITASNIQWKKVMNNIDIQWKSLMDKKSKDDPETPKILKSLNIMKWSKSFCDILHICICVCGVPIVYVIREDAGVPTTCPALMTGQTHSI